MITGTGTGSVLVLDSKVLFRELKGKFQYYKVRAAIWIPHQRYLDVFVR
jgi:hypothetical protein